MISVSSFETEFVVTSDAMRDLAICTDIILKFFSVPSFLLVKTGVWICSAALRLPSPPAPANIAPCLDRSALFQVDWHRDCVDYLRRKVGSLTRLANVDREGKSK